MERGRFEPLVVIVRWGELATLGMLARGALRPEVDMLANASCGEGGMKTAVAIHQGNPVQHVNGGYAYLAERKRRGKAVDATRESSTRILKVAT